jgi:hypothetical protein
METSTCFLLALQFFKVMETFSPCLPELTDFILFPAAVAAVSWNRMYGWVQSRHG